MRTTVTDATGNLDIFGDICDLVCVYVCVCFVNTVSLYRSKGTCVFVCEGVRVFVCVCVVAARNFCACVWVSLYECAWVYGRRSDALYMCMWV